MKVLIACEFSGILREAFTSRGHNAWSCDLLPTEIPGQHICGDVLDILHDNWDLLVAHPPCTHLAVSGSRWFKYKTEQQQQAVEFFIKLYQAPVDKLAVENPISVISTKFRKPDQIIQPWWFGCGETKATCLWLRGLPKLQATNIVSGRVNRIHRESPGPDRWKNRSRTYIGIAQAMAQQWG